MDDEGYHQRLKEEKRAAALRAAMQLFFEQGYERTTLQQIAKRANLSTATLFKRFSSKAALFEAIVEEFWRVDGPPAGIPPAGDPAAGKNQVECAALPDHSRQTHRPQVNQWDAKAAIVDAKYRVTGGDAQVATIEAATGASVLANAASKDSALLVTLPPGVYTANVSGVNNTGGVVLLQAYVVP